jgi:iron complex outermembrane receptor protein
MRLLSSRSRAGVAALLGSSSLLVSPSYGAEGQQGAAAAPAATVEEVLITGSLIRGAPAVGVPVTNLGEAELQETGAVTVSELLRSVPAVEVDASTGAGSSPGNWERLTSVDLRGLSTNAGVRTLMLIDTMRYPVQGHGTCQLDPSIIPSLALSRIDILVDGASATYGSDAIAGVLNVVMRRGFNGAITQVKAVDSKVGGLTLQASQLWGTTWDTGGITLVYEYYDADAVPRSKIPTFTYDFTPWGLDDRTLVRASIPGIVSTGALALVPGAPAGFSAGAGSRWCDNCYSIPQGVGWDFDTQAPGPTTTWAALLANKGVHNQVNAYRYAHEQAAQQRNAATVTFDQEIFEGVQLFVDGFYSNRRAQFYYGGTHNRPGNNALNALTVPTNNPYRPTGAPAAIRVSYLLTDEVRPYTSGYSRNSRWAAGTNLDLPFDWNGRLFYNASEDANYAETRGSVNTNNVLAALGNTVAATANQAAFTKPASIPFLNLFCDPNVFQCNSPQTLNYITGSEVFDQTWNLRQWAGVFDGPLFIWAGGPIRAAVGADYVTNHYSFIDTNSINSISTASATSTPSIGVRNVWAVYAEVNAPIVSEMNRLPLVSRLDLQASVRHDHYNDFGGTTNPRLAADWMPIESLTIRGSWGTSFRAPAFAETSAVAGRVIQPVNSAAGGPSNNVRLCATGSTTPVPGSAGADIIAAGLGFTCSSFPGGVTVGGGSDGLAGLTRPADYALGPEAAESWSAGFQFLPTFLPGLDIHATYFWVQVTDTIAGGGTDLLNPFDRPNILIRGEPGFEDAVNAIVTHPLSTVNPSFASSIHFILEGAARNLGSLKVDGIDFHAGYDWQMGNWGTWGASITGTYYLNRETVGGPGQDPEEAYDSSDDRPGETRESRLRYRARLSWTDDAGISIATILNYRSHYFHTQAFPPQCFISGPVCYPGAEQFPDYNNHVPSNYFIDLSLAYDLLDRPTNPYLQNLRFGLVVNNVFDRKPSFVYRIATNGGTYAHDSGTSIMGRTFSITITKTW